MKTKAKSEKAEIGERRAAVVSAFALSDFPIFNP
jgi:hypothetical protein